MFIKAARGRQIHLHDFNYSYPLPFEFLALIQDIWRLRENVEGYGDSFNTYFKSHSTDRLTIHQKRDGFKRILAVNEKQARIQGLFDFIAIPDKMSRDDNTGTWEVSFNYKFNYQRPDAIFCKYPISVHNQLIPAKYTDHINTELDYQYQTRYYDQDYEALSEFEQDTYIDQSRNSYKFFRIPEYDDFVFRENPSGTSTVFMALVEVEKDKKTLLNLNELGSIVIDPVILNYIKNNREKVVKHMQSFYLFSLWEDHYLKPQGYLELTEDLTLKSLYELDLRKQYRVRFSVNCEPLSLPYDEIVNLLEDREAFIKTINAINIMLRGNPDFQNFQITHISDWMLTELGFVLSGQHPGNQYGNAGKGYTGWPGASNWRDSMGKDGNSGNFLSGKDLKLIEDYIRKNYKDLWMTNVRGRRPSDEFWQKIIKLYYEDHRKPVPKDLRWRDLLFNLSIFDIYEFFKNKRHMMMTVQTTGIIAHPLDSWFGGNAFNHLNKG
jgi:hypothetical protein